MKRISSLLIILSLCIQAHSQDKYVSGDWDFIQYLLGNNMEKDAAVLMRCGAYVQSDTLEFLRGWTCYSIKELDAAVHHFSSVPAESPFYDKSVFFGAVSCAHSGDYERAGTFLDNWAALRTDATPVLKDSYCLEKAGLALLQGDTRAYRDWSSSFSGTGVLKENFDVLERIYSDSYCKTPKKSWKAGLASAVIPGAGQWYAGDKVSGALTFLLEGALAAIIAEQWKHNGPGNWQTYLWTGLGACIHIANIYGATISVSVRNDRLHADRSTAVLYHIHIPLRTVFR